MWIKIDGFFGVCQSKPFFLCKIALNLWLSQYYEKKIYNTKFFDSVARMPLTRVPLARLPISFTYHHESERALIFVCIRQINLLKQKKSFFLYLLRLL